jgi:hypothetical protein
VPGVTREALNNLFPRDQRFPSIRGNVLGGMTATWRVRHQMRCYGTMKDNVPERGGGDGRWSIICIGKWRPRRRRLADLTRLMVGRGYAWAQYRNCFCKWIPGSDLGGATKKKRNSTLTTFLVTV